MLIGQIVSSVFPIILWKELSNEMANITYILTSQ